MTNASVGEEARKGLPQGFKVAAIDVKEPIIAPYVFNAERTDGKIKLTGYFPDQKAHQDILAAAKQRFAGDAVDDQMMQGKGAPNDYAGAIAAGFASLSRLATGSLGVSGNNVTLRGEAFFEKAAGQIRTGFSDAAPQGFRGQSQIAVRAPGARLDAATCQPQLSGLLAKGRILFETAKADIHKDSIGLLDQIAGVSLRCGGSEIEVAGHTDSEGAPERNLNLSKRRAQAVVDYLVEAGVDSGHITAVGYGETKPIASNDTAEGKAQNRRIEMSVK
jgi:OOP family OmpA-OmpF porin